jgi:hypothetical protein
MLGESCHNFFKVHRLHKSLAHIAFRKQVDRRGRYDPLLANSQAEGFSLMESSRLMVAGWTGPLIALCFEFGVLGLKRIGRG